MAIQAELESLRERGTWELVPRPVGAQVLPSELVLKLKRQPDGSVSKYKARLIVLGCLQGNVEKTFSPTVDFTTIRIALALAGGQNAHVHHMDVTGASLHGEISENIHISLPHGFEDKNLPGHVCKLRKGLYGLKQSPRIWHSHLKQKISQIGFKSVRLFYQWLPIWIFLLSVETIKAVAPHQWTFYGQTIPFFSFLCSFPFLDYILFIFSKAVRVEA